MINHARTLLLNVNGNTNPGPGYPGEEYVWPGYTAVTLPRSLERIRNVLFGFDADRAMKNYRLRELLSLVHSNELGNYLTAFDPRITYWPIHDTVLFNTAAFGAAVSLIDGSETWVLSVTGNPSTKKSANRLLDQWQIEVLSASSVKVTHTLPNNEIVTTSYAAGDGVSNAISLPNSELQFTLSTGVLGTGNWPTWTLTHLARPLLTLSDVYASLIQTVESDIDSLFVGDDEPFPTCRELWAMPSGPIAYKLGAVVVGLTYRLDQFYRQQS
jgi:hypothetical protein